jgi:predicted acyltransferase
MSQDRLISVDAFRGLTVAAMVLVNNPGSWNFIYAPLRHAPWHGWTPTDLVFPFFLFIVGISISLSLGRRAAEGVRSASLYVKILKRSALIFGLGLFLHLFPKFHPSTVRIPGVLQRIAVCFLFGALLFLKTRPRTRLILSILILLGYWALLTFVPVPGFGPGVLAEHGNLAGYVDGKLLAGHLYKPDFDPEGLLSTIPAIVTVLLGTMAGDGLRSRHTNSRKSLRMFAWGIALTAAGLLLQRFFPINKQLWTSSYVVFTAGMALLVFALMFAALEGPRWRGWAWPFLVLGTNAIAVFAGSALVIKSILLFRIADGEGVVSPITFAYNHWLSPLAGPYLGSLIGPLLFIVFWVLLIWPLYRNKIFIKL